MSDSIRLIPASSAEYARDYANGWRASQRGTDGALDRADARNVSHAWYDGYEDYAVGNPIWTKRDERLAGDHEPETMARPERPFTVGDMRAAIGPVLSARHVPAGLSDDTVIPAGSDISDLMTGARPQSWRADQEASEPRCATCHRDAHRPGMPTENHGHAYAAPAPASNRPAWNCVDHADGMHLMPGDGCQWCGKTRQEIESERTIDRAAGEKAVTGTPEVELEA